MCNVQSCMKFLALALESPQSSNIYGSIYQNENSGQKSRNNILKSIVISQFQIYLLMYWARHTEPARSHTWMNRWRERQKQKTQSNNNAVFKLQYNLCTCPRCPTHDVWHSLHYDMLSDKMSQLNESWMQHSKVEKSLAESPTIIKWSF